MRHGKGGKARYVPISEEMINLLAKWWLLHRNPRFLFPAVGRRWRTSNRATDEQTDTMRREAMRKAGHKLPIKTRFVTREDS